MTEIIVKNIMIQKITKGKLLLIFIFVCMLTGGISMLMSDKPEFNIKVILENINTLYFILCLTYCDYQFSQIKNRTDFLIK